MPSVFATWDFQRAKKAIDDAASDGLDMRRAYIVDDDHWQNGEAWVGPTPDIADTDYQRVIALIERQFVSQNVLKEVVERHGSGLLGHEPVWGFTPMEPPELDEDGQPVVDEAIKALIAEANHLLTPWWNKRGIHAAFRRATEFALWAEQAQVRFYIPSGLAPNGEIKVEGGNFAEALNFIYCDVPIPGNGIVYVDPETREEVAITLTTFENAEGTEVEQIELVYIDPDSPPDKRVTVIRTISSSDNTADEVPFEMGGFSTVYKIERDLFVTPSMIRQQKAMNLALTMIPKNITDAAFLERTITGAQMPGETVEARDAAGRVFKRFIPDPDGYKIGGGSVNFLQPVKHENEDGTAIFTDPKVQYSPTLSLEPVLDGSEKFYQCILSEAQQPHVLMNEDGRASGKSREQARVIYEQSLRRTKDPVEQAGRELLMAALGMAEVLCGRVGYFTSRLRAYFECKMDTGPVPTDERTQNAIDVDKGLMSEETAMARSGILDVDAEKQMIAAQPTAKLRIMKEQAMIIASIGAAMPTVPPAVLAEMVGMTQDQINLLKSFPAAAAASRPQGTPGSQRPDVEIDSPAGPGTSPENTPAAPGSVRETGEV